MGRLIDVDLIVADLMFSSRGKGERKKGGGGADDCMVGGEGHGLPVGP